MLVVGDAAVPTLPHTTTLIFMARRDTLSLRLAVRDWG